MKKLILTVGCPGSGKSTFAKIECAKGNTVNLNRDSFREMVKALDERNEWKFNKSNEALVTELQIGSLDFSFERNDRVIISDTNLNPSTRARFEDYAKAKNIKVEYVNLDIPWKELVRRNNYRGNKAVPISVLRDMYSKMREYMGKKKYSPIKYTPKAIIVDMDGTTCKMVSRHPFEFDKVLEDEPHAHVIKLIQLYKLAGYKIIFLSGREKGKENKCYDDSLTWIKRELGYGPDEFFMREHKDPREDSEVKEEIFWREIAPYYDVEMVLDDRQSVVEMWRFIGLNCAQVAAGDF